MGNLILQQHQQVFMDLSCVSDHSIELILLRVPAKDLLLSCTLVSSQWNQILSSKSFWVDWAQLRNYRLPWRHFIPTLSLRSVRHVAIRRPFGRNFVRDVWDMSKVGTAECLISDKRWEFNQNLQIEWPDNNSAHQPRIEIPPNFLDGSKVWHADDGTEEVVNECVAISYRPFRKRIVIKLTSEGLTDEILDDIAPKIVVSELVANRRDCASMYNIKSRINFEMQQMAVSDAATDMLSKETEKKFLQWEDERWHKIEHVFSNYPKGVRHLVVECSGHDNQFWAGNYGPKIAKFTVKALCPSDK